MNTLINTDIFDVDGNTYKIKSVFKENVDSTLYLTEDLKIMKIFKDSDDKNLRKKLRAISIHNKSTNLNWDDLDSIINSRPTYFYNNIALPKVLLKEPYIGYVIDCKGFNRSISSINKLETKFVDRLQLSINIVEELIKFESDGFVLNNLNPKSILFNDLYDVLIIDCDSLTQGAYVSSLNESEYHDPYVLNYLMIPSTLSDTFSVFVIVFELLYDYPFGNKNEYLANKGKVDSVDFDSILNCTNELKILFHKMFVDCKNRYIDRPSLMDLYNELNAFYNRLVCCEHCGNEFYFIDSIICPRCNNYCRNNYILKLGKKIMSTNEIMPMIGLKEFESINLDEIKKNIVVNRRKKIYMSDFDEFSHKDLKAFIIVDNNRNVLQIKNITNKTFKITNELNSTSFETLKSGDSKDFLLSNRLSNIPIYIIVEDYSMQHNEYGDIRTIKYLKLEELYEK